MEKQEGLFELNGQFYTLKLNFQKVKVIEKMLGISFVAEISNTGGMLSFSLLEAIFAVGLHDVQDEKAVKGVKASNIYEQLLKDVGYSDVMSVVVGKVEEDLGFLFQ